MTNKQAAPAAPVITLMPCKSSNISHHGYDAETKTLAVKFSSGTVYHYPSVPAEVIERMGKAKSLGAFFATDIRNTFKGVKQEAAAE